MTPAELNDPKWLEVIELTMPHLMVFTLGGEHLLANPFELDMVEEVLASADQTDLRALLLGLHDGTVALLTTYTHEGKTQPYHAILEPSLDRLIHDLAGYTVRHALGMCLPTDAARELPISRYYSEWCKQRGL